jgi:two-component system LytT family response regulator
LKPVTPLRLQEAVRRAVDRARTVSRTENTQGLDKLLAEMPESPSAGARIPVRGDGSVDLVNVADITWVEADGDHAVLHIGPNVLSLRETMGELENRLAPFRFVRVHRSAIVNADAARSVVPSARRWAYCSLVYQFWHPKIINIPVLITARKTNALCVADQRESTQRQ